MNILGLMLKAVRGTVEEQVQRALDGFGESEAPVAPARGGGPATPEPQPQPLADQPVPSFEVVDALFPGAPRGPEAPMAAGPEAAAPGASGTAAAAPAQPAPGVSPAAPPAPAAQQAASPEARPLEPGAVEPSTAETRAQEEQDARAVLLLLERHGTPLRGYGIAEGTGIAPWWRLKDVLQRLTREGKVVQTEDGMFALRTDADRAS